MTQFCVRDTQPLHEGWYTAGTQWTWRAYTTTVHTRTHACTHTLSSALPIMAHLQPATDPPFAWNPPCKVPTPERLSVPRNQCLQLKRCKWFRFSQLTRRWGWDSCQLVTSEEQMLRRTQALAIFVLCQPLQVGLSSWAASFVVQGADPETRI